MSLVNNIEDIIDNANTLNEYLQSDEDREYALDRIEQGICFVVIRNEDGSLRFYPSKFVGYLRNNREVHQDQIRTRDGRHTNRRITRILNGDRPRPLIYETEYREFCLNELHISPPSHGALGYPHKYWEQIIENH